MKIFVAFCLLVLIMETMAAPNRADAEKARLQEEEKIMQQGTAKRAELPEKEDKRDDGDAFKRSEVEDKRDDGDAFKRSSTDEASCTTHANINIWPGGNIYYAFCNSEVDTPVVRTAIGNLATLFEGILNFIEENVDCDNPPTVDHFIAINNQETGCWSYIGMTGGLNQVLNLGTGCYTNGVVMHEMLHAIGAFHEQQRPDASENININWNNIKPGKEDNFKSKSGMCTACKYQTCSIMQYRAAAFKISGGGNTISAKESGYGPDMGKQKYVSAGDYCKIYLMYDGTTADEAKGCNPDDCKFGTGRDYHLKCCKCSEHFSGTDCGTFKTVHSDDSQTSLDSLGDSVTLTNVEIDDDNNNKYDPLKKMTHLVTAPENCKLKVTPIWFDVEDDTDCYWDQVFIWKSASVLDCPLTLCGNKAKNEMKLGGITESNFYLMAFVSDDMYQFKGYEMKFEVVECT